MIVVDASVALSWVLGENASVEAQSALDYVVEHGARAPGNFQSEVAHTLLNAERRGFIDETDLSVAISELLLLPIDIELPDPHVIVSIGREHRLTGYDAAYLALARQAQLPLATSDAALRKAARSENLLWRP
jgi:predicted nucleic acid-binding protein